MQRLLHTVFANFRGDFFFSVVMMSSAGFGFAKTVALASLISPTSFGVYISIFGMATFAAMLLSFGSIESTYKRYPQLVALSREFEIMPHARRLFQRMVVRVFLFFFLALPLVSVFSPFGLDPAALGVMALLTCVFVLQTLVASVIRSLDAERLLPRFTVARGITALVLTAPIAAITKDWLVVLVVEAGGIALVSTATALLIHQGMARRSGQTRSAGTVPEVPDDPTPGRLMYYEGLIAALIPYGGRPVIAVIEGPAMAGAYGLLNVLVQIAQLLASALSQKLGPSLIQEATLLDNAPRMGWAQRFGLPTMFLILSAVITFIGVAISFLFPVGAAFWHDYGISIQVLAIASVQMVMSAYLYLYFGIVAENREIDLVRAASAAATVFFGGVTLTALSHTGLTGYALSAAAAYGTLTVYLFVCYRKAINRHA